jgi:integrase
MEAAKVGLIASSPFDLVKAPKAKRVNAGRALTPDEAKALMRAAEPLRLGAAVALLFCQGWRASEVLGLAWEDLDLEAGTAQIRRGVSYSTSVGTALGSTKTSGAEGIHYLAPISVERLRQRREEQEAERALMGAEWPERGRGRVDGVHDQPWVRFMRRPSSPNRRPTSPDMWVWTGLLRTRLPGGPDHLG